MVGDMMIDYNKLKMAHELAHQAKIDLVTTVRTFEDGDCRLSAAITGLQHTNDIDGIIDKLKELTKPEPKYALGDKVWIIDYEHGPVETMICEIDTASREMYYENEYQEWREENELYPSRQALIEDQVDYWISLSDKSATEILCEKIEDDAQKRFNEIIGESKMCPECGKKGMSEGRCWNEECRYMEPEECEHDEYIAVNGNPMDCEPVCKHCNDVGETQIVTPSGKFTDPEPCIYCQDKYECEHCGEAELIPLPLASTDLSVSVHVADNIIKCKKCGEFYR